MRKRIIVLVLSISLLALVLVVGSAWLVKKAKDVPPPEEQITMEEIAHLLSEADEKHRIAFLEECATIYDDQGYWIKEDTIHKLISYIKEQQPQIGLDYYKFHVVSVSDGMILIQTKKEKQLLDYDVNEMEGVSTDIQPGDLLHVIATKDTILQIVGKEASEIVLDAVWIMANSDEQMKIKYAEKEFAIANFDDEYTGYEDIADVVIRAGGVSEVRTYTDKINARLLSIKDHEIELEGLGIYPYTDDIQVYKLFGEFEPYTLSDLKIGYAFTDFVLNDKKEIVAALVSGEGYLDKIRVVVKTTGFESAYHEQVVLSCDTDMEWRSGEKSGQIKSGEQVTISTDSELFEENRITFIPVALSAKTTIFSVERNQGFPAYRGTIEVEKTPEGLLVVNELSLDEYLYSVVPSEMPASYPLEALKAQAVSARTYAYAHMLSSRLQSYGAHVDDSAAFQVYNNIMEHEATTRAVRETEGIIVGKDEKPVTTYFYSTSCGYGTDLTAWISENDTYLCSKKIGEGDMLDMTDEEVFDTFIRQSDTSCYEATESYFRWKYETSVNEEVLLSNLQKRYEANPEQVLTKTAEGYEVKPIDKFGTLQDIVIEKRAPGGAVTQLLLVGSKATFRILSEKNVRYILAGESTQLWLGENYEKEGKANGMLPSAFLTIDKLYDESGNEETEVAQKDGEISAYVIYGGGFGHGIGMSQNGARQMASRGMMFGEILKFFYVETDLLEMKREEE